jgi:nicotinamide-nucleotide amidase
MDTTTNSGTAAGAGPYGPAPAAEIVAAGNEVLLGDVQDSNSYFLCRHVTALGGRTSRIVMVHDDVEAIAAELRGALAREPVLVFTVGGLGPTNDDTTLAGVAAATGRPLELHPEAERMVSEKYAEFAARGFVPFAEMNASRRKMALLPRGSEPVVNPVGGAPGVLLRVGGTAIVSLPGVPEELVAIVEESLDELFAELFGRAHYDERALIVDLQDESAIADVLEAVDIANPEVYVKSRARVMGPHRKIRITLSARGDDHAAVAALIAPPLAALVAGIEAAGFTIRIEDR